MNHLIKFPIRLQRIFSRLWRLSDKTRSCPFNVAQLEQTGKSRNGGKKDDITAVIALLIKIFNTKELTALKSILKQTLISELKSKEKNSLSIASGSEYIGLIEIHIILIVFNN